MTYRSRNQPGGIPGAAVPGRRSEDLAAEAMGRALKPFMRGGASADEVQE